MGASKKKGGLFKFKKKLRNHWLGKQEVPEHTDPSGLGQERLGHLLEQRSSVWGEQE